MTRKTTPRRSLPENLLFWGAAIIGGFSFLVLFTSFTTGKPSVFPLVAGLLALLLSGLGYLARLTRLISARSSVSTPRDVAEAE